MKKITTALLSMLVVTSAFNMAFPILSNDVNAQPDDYYQDDRVMKDYGDDGYSSYRNGPDGYDNYRSGYDDYTYDDQKEKKPLNIYDRFSLVESITVQEGPATLRAECDDGDKYLSGGFTTDLLIRDPLPRYEQLDSVPDLDSQPQAHVVTFDLNADELPDERPDAANFQAFVVCLDTNTN